MIGLGSNRLSVCRRGGMSVTQAGRGGMEWLAGGRFPSWASPYSAQATAALLAQFPTQWPTIRDYGFAHPALVPFINEDPMMVMSLIEGLGTRWLVGDGNAYIISGIRPYTDTIIETRVGVEAAGYAFGTTDGGSTDYFGVNFWRGNQFECYLGTGSYPKAGTWVANTMYEVVIDATTKKFYVNGTNIATVNNPLSFANHKPFYIFGLNYGTGGNASRSIFEYIRGKRGSGNYDGNYVPHIVGTNGLTADKVAYGGAQAAGAKGMLDIVNCIFYPNANSSGSFTISETPAS